MADLTITKDRIKKIDFSMPFDTYGIIIMMKKSPILEKNIFVFLSPLAIDVWIAVAGAMILGMYAYQANPNEKL